jgi:hypothetical protein
MPKGSPGKKHPADCAHCAAVNSKKRYFYVDGERVPRCICHEKPMAWNKVSRLKSGGQWRCSVIIKKQSRTSRLRKLGITERQYQEMLFKQNNSCAICGGPPDTRWKKLAVDHCHSTGKVRGLLCMVCNTMLGRFERNKEKIMEYLAK